MKLLCLVLTVYVILLSVRPCCTDNDCRATSTNKKEVADRSPVKEKDCRGCSPFFSCGTCGCTIIAQLFLIDFKPATEPTGKNYAVHRSPYLQQVTLAIWQPPQLS